MKLNFTIILQDTQFKVISTKEATESYKHILWLGKFMMFEFVYDNKKHTLSMGVASFTEYRSCIKLEGSINHIDGHISRIDEFLKTFKGKNVCMMITTELFLNELMYKFIIRYAPHRSESKISKSSLEYMSYYEQIMQIFIPFYIKPLYQEPEKYLEKRFMDFKKYHSELFAYDQVYSCLSNFIQPTMSMKNDVCKCDYCIKTDPENLVCDMEFQVPICNHSYSLQKSPLTKIQGKSSLIQKPCNDLHKICAHIKYNFSKYICNCTSKVFNLNNLPFFDSSKENGLYSLLSKILEIIKTYLCGSIKDSIRVETQILSLIVQKKIINKRLAIAILHAVDNIYLKTICYKNA